MGLVCTKKHLTFAGKGASILRVPWKTASAGHAEALVASREKRVPIFADLSPTGRDH